jgi:hypothetical protein
MNAASRIALFAVFLLCQSALHAARLSGTIKDPQGAVIPGTQAVLTNEATGLQSNASASQTGEYVFL